MKNIILFLFLIQITSLGQGQSSKGKIIVEQINALSLKNIGGENSTRRITIYLPPDYDLTTNRYPVIYFLHGFTMSDSLQIARTHFDNVLDKAITTGKIRPVIVVMPNQYTLYKGSWYTNSSLTGNWADFTSKDLVEFVDKNYRTIPNKNSRGIAGHSMGGHGALKMAMLFPDVFTTVYGLSPAVLALAKEFGPERNAFRQAGQINSRVELLQTDFPLVCVAMGRAFSPNPSKPPFYCDLPYTYSGDRLIVNDEIMKLWNMNLPLYMVDENIANLRKLKAIKFDWGRNENFPHIPVTCQMFSQKLENSGIQHYAEEYIGDHGNKVWTDDGRALNDMLPFFNTYLTFEELNYKTQDIKKQK